MRHGVPAFLFLVAAIVINLRRIFANKALPESAVECRSAYLVMSTGLFFTLSTVHVWGGPSVLVMALIGGGAWMAEGRDERTEVGSRARIRRLAAARDRGPNGSPNGRGRGARQPGRPGRGRAGAEGSRACHGNLRASARRRAAHPPAIPDPELSTPLVRGLGRPRRRH